MGRNTLSIVQGGARETRTINLGDWADDWAEATIEVWVTPTRAHTERYREILQGWQEIVRQFKDLSPEEKLVQGQALEDRENEWYAQSWEGYDVEGVAALRKAMSENAPGSWAWLIQRSSELVREFREDRLKNSRGD